MTIIFRSCFLETLKVSDNLGSAQLKYVCLAILGRFFTTTVPQQAEKMLTAAFGQAKKAGHVEFMAACCGLFVSLYKTLCAGHEVEEKGGGGGGGGVGGSSSEKIKEEEETVMNRHKRKLAEYETLQIELDQHAAASLAKGVQLLKEIR